MNRQLLLLLRNFKRNKLVTLINILGISGGISISFMIFYFVSFETTYDSGNNRNGSLYRLIHNDFASTNGFMGPILKDYFSTIKGFTRLHRGGNELSYENQSGERIQFFEEKIFWADTSFFSFFPAVLKEGESGLALKNPYSIVLTETLARKYFGNESPMGATMRNGNYSYIVTGVASDPPQNSHLQYTALISLSTWEASDQRTFNPSTGKESRGFFTYISVNTDEPRKLADEMATYMNTILKDQKTTARLQPVDDIYLGSEGILMDVVNHGDRDMVNYLFAAALLILLLSWSNHINLSISQNSRRIKEVGIKRSFGASQTTIFRELVVESLILEAIVLLIATLFISLLKSGFDSIFQNPFLVEHLPYLLMSSPHAQIFVAITIGALVISVVGPAIILTRYGLVSSLRNDVEMIKGLSFRKALLFFQYSVSIILVAVSLGVYKQIMHMKQKDFGIAMDQTIVVTGRMTPNPDDLAKLSTFKAETIRNAGVSNVSISTAIPGIDIGRKGEIRRQGETNAEASTYDFVWTDENFLKCYKVSLISGSDFSENPENSKTSMIINSTAMTSFGFKTPEEAINQKTVTFFGGEYTIIGVIKDFDQTTPMRKHNPLVILSLSEAPPGPIYFSVRLKDGLTDEFQSMITLLREVWNKVYPELSYNYFFLDDFFSLQFKNEMHFGKLLMSLTITSLLLTAFGILGLSSLLAEQKSREASIRKVLGASVGNIFITTSKTFTQLLLVSALLGIPLSIWWLNDWLSVYEYKTSMGIVEFVLPFILVSLISLATSSYHILAVSRSNPAKVLKSQ